MAKRGRKPKPTAQKKLEGNPGKRKLNKKEPKYQSINSNNVPKCPDILDEKARDMWTHTCILLGNSGLLTEADQAALAVYCTNYSIWIQAQEKIQASGLLIEAPSGYPIQNPYLGIANKAMKHMQWFWTEFGLTPSARVRIEIPHIPQTPQQTNQKESEHRGIAGLLD